MIKIIPYLIAFIAPSITGGQDIEALPEFEVAKWEVESKLRFLSSDELEGRRAGERGNDIAARYIADHFKALGLKTAPNSDDYFQAVQLVENTIANKTVLTIEGKEPIDQSEVMLLKGKGQSTSAPVVFAEYGLGEEDLKNIDVKDKIVITLAGSEDSENFRLRPVYSAAKTKIELLEDKGALALIEITTFRRPLSIYKKYLRSSTQVDYPEDDETESSTFTYGWVSQNVFSSEFLDQIRNGDSVLLKIETDGAKQRKFSSNNVIGIVEGTDPELKNEYILLSAHFDHVGFGRKANASGNYVNNDSIYNGARDNAIGTSALMIAAQSLAVKPAKRSIIFIGFTAEEMGLLGSEYYAAYPLIPLDQTVYNHNVDGPGYNSTEHISIQGFEKTNADPLFEKAIKSFGLQVLKNPVPEQRGYYRSDNIVFARAGIPAVSMHQGVLAFDEELSKYYHQAIDEADSVDMDYAHKFAQIFSYASRLIANMEERPYWQPGDEFEEAAKKLYEMD